LLNDADMNLRPCATFSVAACAALAAALQGCWLGVDSGPGNALPPAPTPASAGGSITVRWLVAGVTDPAACAAYGASGADVVVYDAGGQPFVEQTAPCSDFGLTVQLPEGTYSAEVTLLGANNAGVSPTQPLDQLRVIEGTDLAVDVNFPL
jgi:hypothetical protein